MANITSSAAACCLTLSLLLNNITFFPGTQVYRSSLDSYFSLQQTDLSPSCIVAPHTAEDVSLVVRTLVNTNASSPSCKFAIRSGGHSSFVGASNIQDGVTIDLRGLDSIEVGQDGSEVSVGPGATWSTVYSQLDILNMSVAGGRSASVGVGGLSVGGGISYFAPRYGWTCDTVTNFEVVLANGSIINANEKENADLLWALRGGGNNFGIVTRINLQTFQQSELWGGSTTHLVSTADEQIIALSNFSLSPDYDEYSSLITTFAYSGAQEISVIVNSMEYTQAVVNPPVFHQITNISSVQSTMRITNMTDLAFETEELQGIGLRYDTYTGDAEDYLIFGLRETTATLTIEPTVEAIRATVQAWNASVDTIRDVPGIVWSLVFDPLPPSTYSRHAETNALGLTGRQDKSLMVVQLSATWSDEDQDEMVQATAMALMESIGESIGKLGALDPFIYLNYAAAWQKPIASYGMAEVARLNEVRREYDPQQIFNKNVPGGFKLVE